MKTGQKFLIFCLVLHTVYYSYSNAFAQVDQYLLLAPESERTILNDFLSQFTPHQKSALENILVALDTETARKLLNVLSTLPNALAAAEFIEVLITLPPFQLGGIINEVYNIPSADLRISVVKEKTALMKQAAASSIEKFYYVGPYSMQPIFSQVGYDIFSRGGGTALAPPENYVLGPNDEIYVYIWGGGASPLGLDYPISLTVSLDGRIFVPKVGPLSVWGLTISDAQNVIKGAFSKIFRGAEVSISLSKMRGVPVLVLGEVKNQGFVTLSGSYSPFDAIVLAGGISKSGSMRNVSILRKGKEIAKIDFYKLIFEGQIEDSIAGMTLREYDVIYVPPIGETFAIGGMVKRGGIYEMIGKSNLGDAINAAGGIMPQNASTRIRIKRYTGETREIILDKTLSSFDSEILNTEIKDGDYIEIIPAMTEESEKFVLVSGYVRKPGQYNWFKEMTLKDAVLLSGGFPEVYPPDSYEISRFKGKWVEEKIKGNENLSKLKNTEILDKWSSVEIKPFDTITIIPPNLGERKLWITCTIQGEVLRPGSYILQKGQKLPELLKKGEGFTKDAYLQGIVFTRRTVYEEQKKRIDEAINALIKEVYASVGKLGVAGLVPPGEEAIIKTQIDAKMKLISFMKGLSPSGRLVIKDADLKDLSKIDIELEDGDVIFVPKKPNFVIVTGEVRNPGTFLWEKGKDAYDYIEIAGGFSKYADKGETYIIRSTGEVSDELEKVSPGDTIMVPFLVEVPTYRWYLIRDTLSLSFSGMTAGAIMWQAIKVK